MVLKPSFTMLELVVVIIIIGIMASVINISIPNNKLRNAADEIVLRINTTRSLALKDDKYQPFPKNNTSTEYNRSKYWFKQWWQIRFSTFEKNGETHYWYEIFSDVPDENKTKNFTCQANLPTSAWNISIAKDTNGKLLIGHCNASQYPDCNQTNKNLDLTKTYGIKNIKFVNFYPLSHRLVFDNYGNVFLREGNDSDAGDINPLDKNYRNILTKTANIKLCTTTDCDDKHCIQINITPTGFAYISKCK